MGKFLYMMKLMSSIKAFNLQSIIILREGVGVLAKINHTYSGHIVMKIHSIDVNLN